MFISHTAGFRSKGPSSQQPHLQFWGSPEWKTGDADWSLPPSSASGTNKEKRSVGTDLPGRPSSSQPLHLLHPPPGAEGSTSSNFPKHLSSEVYTRGQHRHEENGFLGALLREGVPGRVTAHAEPANILDAMCEGIVGDSLSPKSSMAPPFLPKRLLSLVFKALHHVPKYYSPGPQDPPPLH